MSLAERLKNAKPEPLPQRQQCRTCAWLQNQSPKDREAFEDWITKGRPHAQLRRECQAVGLEISESSFGRHIRTCMGTAP